MESTEDTKNEPKTAICCSYRRIIRTGSIVGIVVVTGYLTMPHWLGFVLGGSDDSSTSGIDKKIELSNVSNVDESHLQFVGKWTMTSKNGLRTMTLNDDRTGLLIYEPTSFVHKMALGKRVEVDLAWDKKGNYVEFESLQGRPKGAFKTASAMEGKYKKRRIESIDDEKMVLVNELIDETDKKNKPQSIWYRVKE